MVSLSPLAVKPVALTAEFDKVKEAESVPVMLYQSEVSTVSFKVAAQVKDTTPEGTN